MNRKIDRLDKYLRYKSLSDNKVTVALSLSVGVLGKSRKDGRDLSDKITEKVLNFYTDLNRVWLLTGEGEMLNIDTVGAKNEKECKELISDPILSRTLEILDVLKEKGYSFSDIAKQLEASPSLVTEMRKYRTGVSDKTIHQLVVKFNINENYIRNGVGEPFIGVISNAREVATVNTVNVPFIPVQARATFIETFDTACVGCEQMTIFKVPGIIYENGLVFEVNGDSMEPTLISGERVYAEYVSPGNWVYLNGIVVISFDNYVVVKRIRENKLMQGELTLLSDNEAGGTITLSIDKNRINQIYKVKYTVYKPLM